MTRKDKTPILVFTTYFPSVKKSNITLQALVWL